MKLSLVGLCAAMLLVVATIVTQHASRISALRTSSSTEFAAMTPSASSDFPGAGDQIDHLPGQPEGYASRMFSGYLPLENGGNAFYFFAESQSTQPELDPVVLWLNGGPGASSLVGCFTENGPLLVNDDGHTLRKNDYSWNNKANLLCIESPVGVGYSWSAAKRTALGVYVSDDLAQAKDLYDALQKFFGKFPWLRENDFIISGESYGGVYVPTTARAIVQGNGANILPKINLKKFAVGNGVNEFSGISVMLFAYYHGLIGTEDYQAVRTACPEYKESTASGSFLSLNMTSSCGQAVVRVLTTIFQSHINSYNVYAQCAGLPLDGVEKITAHYLSPTNGFSHPVGNPLSLCLNNTDTSTYFNLPEVKAALHANTSLGTWSSAVLTDSFVKLISLVEKEDLDTRATLSYTSTLKSTVTPIWRELLAAGVKGVIYHGDVDIVCDFMSGQWAVESMELRRKSPRAPWMVNASGVPQSAGFVEQFEGLTFLTVKGAGHMVPMWKPAEASEMLKRFILQRYVLGSRPFSQAILNLTNDTPMAWSKINTSVQPSGRCARKERSREEAIPLTGGTGQHQPLTTKHRLAGPARRYAQYGAFFLVCMALGNLMVFQRQSFDGIAVESSVEEDHPGAADQIIGMPGLPEDYTARVFSGYLPLNNGGQAFYFFAESQSAKAEEDPVLLWLNGGPGASSLAGCFSENGPLLVNDDGETLRVNEYAWNKRANLLCIESPIGVGFSYNTSGVYSATDLSQADDLYEALQQFFVKFPWLLKNELVVSGESYGGVYVPTTARAIVEGNKKGDQPKLNLKKFVVGNGVNEFTGLSSVLFAYYHGFISTDDYNAVRNACPDMKESSPSANGMSVDLSEDCGRTLVTTLSSLMLAHINMYDVYRRCAGAPMDGVRALISEILQPQSGYPHPLGNPMVMCLNYSSSEVYFNRQDVRTAMHTNADIEHWTNDALTSVVVERMAPMIGIDYRSIARTKYLEYSGLLKQEVTPLWRYLLDHGVQGVIYHGDADMMCDLIGGLWAVESLQLPREVARKPWFVNMDGVDQSGGFVEQFANLTYLTVKGAGHMVPMWKPVEAEVMLERFILN
ncbi:TPA: hypothetical protein N0F65_011594 [Lagenidium giganteum]|uniref:Carboxypeptidase n=1 Tax=Lagenidium giganteum TaxID=4803 RepID=A0AAV2ZBB7_9STRA|nr:TPA: hypothetical protein N0F65_011594 [Lagenidium giganteum]